MTKNQKSINTTIMILAFINIIVFVMEVQFNRGINISSETALHFGANYGYNVIQQGQILRLFTAMFVHLSVMHIASNLLSLYIFSRVISELYNTYQFILIYFISGIVGNIGSLLIHPNIVSAGASTAIMGMVGSMVAVIASTDRRINKKDYIQYALLLLILNTVVAGSGVDVAGHTFGAFGGMIVGFICVIINNIKNKNKVNKFY